MEKKRMTEVEMEAAIMSHLAYIEMEQYPKMEFFGSESISRDIGSFLKTRLSLIYFIAESKFIENLDIENAEQENKVIANIKSHTCLPDKKVLELMEHLISISKEIQTKLFCKWRKKPQDAPQKPSPSLDALRRLILENDKDMLDNLASNTLTKADIMHFLFDFHFSHSYLEPASCKEIKVLLYEIMRNKKAYEPESL